MSSFEVWAKVVAELDQAQAALKRSITDAATCYRGEQPGTQAVTYKLLLAAQIATAGMDSVIAEIGAGLAQLGGPKKGPTGLYKSGPRAYLLSGDPPDEPYE